MKLFKPDRTSITKWDEWTRPKRDYQWKPGRSAMELAKAWFREDRPAIPAELLSLFAKHRRLEQLDILYGIPELVTPLPERGEGRNHDLCLYGKTHQENVTVCIEAKADEPFGDFTVGEYWSRGLKRRVGGVRTRVPERVKALLSMVNGTGSSPLQSPWANVRYQLLTAICGTILEAQKDLSSLGLFIVHEFQTDSTCQEKLQRNMKAFLDFIKVLSGSSEAEPESGCWYGPVRLGDVDILISKISTIKADCRKSQKST